MKFFKQAESSSDSSDSDDSEREIAPPPKQPILRDFAYLSDSDDENRDKRVVRTQKDKAYSELKDKIHQAQNARNIKDMNKLLSCFENLVKAYDKAKTVMVRENLTIPRFYIRYLAELEDFVNEQWEDPEAKKKIKNLSVLRQKLRKYNKDFETELQKYRVDPDPIGYSSGAAEEDDEELEIKQPVVPETLKVDKKVAKSKVKDESDSESWKSDSSDESNDSDLDFDIRDKKIEELRLFFLKKDPSKTTKAKQTKREIRPRAKKGGQGDLEDENEEGGWQKVTHKDDKGPLFDSSTEITVEVVCAKLNEIISQRGRKNTNRKLFVSHLEELCKIAEDNKLGSGVIAKIFFAHVTSLFEIDVKITDAMEYSAWEKTLRAFDGFLSFLAENPNVNFSAAFTEDDENISDNNKPYNLHGSIVMLVKRLDDELTKIFQHSDCHSTDYIDKLKGEKKLCDVVEKAKKYIDSRENKPGFEIDDLAAIYMLNIEHVYYKFTEDPDNEKLMDNLCKKIYSLKNATFERQRALLCQVYHHALHDRYDEAKELLLMSHVQIIVDHSESSTQILYNRAICQLGLCAFRHGHIKEAHQGLSEIHNTQRPKELLAQGVALRQMDRTPEQETRERRLQVPYHMHINLEVMEYVYLICSMLLEIPNIACHEYDLRRRLLSRSFHYQLKVSERSALIGPPESTREHVVAASRAMLKGDWRKCRDYIINEKMNAKVWNLFRDPEKVKNMVSDRIQKETLRTYLLMYCTVYTTVSFDTLCNLFELSRQDVYSLVSRMIIQEELSATLDEPTNCLTMHRLKPSRLQLLAFNLTDKLNQLAENNEQIIEPRGRNYMGPGNWMQRADRGGDDKMRRGNFQNDRFGNNRFNKPGQSVATGQQQNRRRDQKSRY